MQQFVDVTYESDPTLQTCPNEAEFHATLVQQLGYDPHRPLAPSGVRVRVRPTETGIEATIDWSNPAEKHIGERRFASRSDECPKMIATVGFVVAVQIQLMAAESAPGPEVGAVGKPLAEPGDLPGSDRVVAPRLAKMTLAARGFDVRSPAPREATDRAILAGMGPSIGFGLGPAPVGLGRLFVAARFGWIGLEVGVEQSVPTTTTEDYGGGFEHALTLGTLAACGWYGSSISACAVAKLGRVHVNGIGVDRPASPDGFSMQVGPRVAYALFLGNHFLLLGRVEALHLVTPWAVDLNHETVWTTPRLGAVAGIDVAARFR